MCDKQSFVYEGVIHIQLQAISTDWNRLICRSNYSAVKYMERALGMKMEIQHVIIKAV